MASGPMPPANLLFCGFIFQSPLKSGLVCAPAIKAQSKTIAAIVNGALILDFMGSSICHFEWLNEKFVEEVCGFRYKRCATGLSDFCQEMRAVRPRPRK